MALPAPAPPSDSRGVLAPVVGAPSALMPAFLAALAASARQSTRASAPQLSAAVVSTPSVTPAQRPRRPTPAAKASAAPVRTPTAHSPACAAAQQCVREARSGAVR
eukprot:TRINITY_DN1830_c0_g1_i2.p3 TRINITY_DN1830_c0_g1~~TRINITY_DN1830_c0_g1_i2.p3  ORF type:complete len:106 (-),score=11.63 TRINITY_DN1830_c0_g1_i2:414-731(-)